MFLGLLKEYLAQKQRQLNGKLSNFKSVSQNINDYMDSDYYVNITVGTPGQFFTVILDTSLTSMLIPDVKCNRCQSKRKFNSSKSSTYQSTNYSYGGDPANGVYGQDFVRLGNSGADQLVIPSAMFAQILGDVGNYVSDGIIGLGLTAENDVIDSPIVTAIKAGILDYPIVTIFLKSLGGSSIGNGGMITYGAIDTVNCDRNIIYEPLTTPDSFKINVKSTTLGSSQFSGNWETIIDTGSSILLGPESIVNAFAKEVNASYDFYYDLYTIDCDAQFNLDLTIGSTVYTLTEKQMVSSFEGTCFFGLLSLDTDTWVLGSPWFSTVCNILDYGNKRIGFANITSI